MPTCHIAIMSPYASLKLWPVSPSEANIDQFHPECSLVTQTMVPPPQRSPGRCRPPNTISGSGLKPLVPPWLLGGTAYTCSGTDACFREGGGVLT